MLLTNFPIKNMYIFKVLFDFFFFELRFEALNDILVWKVDQYPIFLKD